MFINKLLKNKQISESNIDCNLQAAKEDQRSKFDLEQDDNYNKAPSFCEDDQDVQSSPKNQSQESSFDKDCSDMQDLTKPLSNQWLNTSEKYDTTPGSSTKSATFTAALLTILSFAFSASQQVCAKIFFESRPDISEYQLLAYRSILSTTINLLIVNLGVK